MGAHHAEECIEYIDMDWGPVIWVEAIPELAKKLKAKLDPSRNKVVQALVWHESNIEIEFRVASQTMASSIFEFGEHSKLYPDIFTNQILKLRTTSLRDLLTQNDCIDLIVLDIQGAELQALFGLGERITEAKWIYTEISKLNLFESGTRLEDLDRYLDSKGFSRRSTRILAGENWGEALYVSESLWDEVGILGRIRGFTADVYFKVCQLIYRFRYRISQSIIRPLIRKFCKSR